MAIVPDAKASYSGCSSASHVISAGDVTLDDLQVDESLCVSTSEGAWATLKLSNDDSGEYTTVTLDIWLHKPAP
jgi:hypothetical protein